MGALALTGAAVHTFSGALGISVVGCYHAILFSQKPLKDILTIQMFVRRTNLKDETQTTGMYI